MKGFGIVLIIVQAIAIFGSITSNEYLDMLVDLTSVRGVGNFVGFHIIGLIGIVLLIKSIKKEKKHEFENSESEYNE